MRYGSPVIFFINEPRVNKPARMLRNRLDVAAQALRNPLNRNAAVSGDKRQNLNAPVIGNALDMALHLPRRFYRTSHIL